MMFGSRASCRAGSLPPQSRGVHAEPDAEACSCASFNDGAADLRGRIIGIYGLLIAVNVAAWAWALSAFHDYPVLLGTAFLAYGFGLRHAVDADHIAAIDNVTRKLMQEGKRPIAAGLYLLARPFDRGGAGLDRRRRDGGGLQGAAGRISRPSAA